MNLVTGQASSGLPTPAPPVLPGPWRQRWRKLVRAWRSHPRTWPLRLAWAHAMRLLVGAPGPVRVLLCSDERFYTSEQQWAPVWRWAGGLARRHGVVLCHRRIGPGHPGSVRHWGQFDLIGLKLCQQVVAQHGGQLREEHDDGQRNFLIDLPTGAPFRSEATATDIAQAQVYARDLAALMARRRDSRTDKTA